MQLPQSSIILLVTYLFHGLASADPSHNETTSLAKRDTQDGDDIDPEGKCNSSCIAFDSNLRSCDITQNGQVIQYTSCLCKHSTFDSDAETCYKCIATLANQTWTDEMAFLMLLCTETGLTNMTGFLAGGGLPNGRGSGTNGGTSGGGNTTITMDFSSAESMSSTRMASSATAASGSGSMSATNSVGSSAAGSATGSVTPSSDGSRISVTIGTIFCALMLLYIIY